MTTVHFRFYAELNDFLPKNQRLIEFPYEFAGRQSVKHLIEAAGVPHTEVDLVLVNGASVDFSYFPEDGDRISVYPVFEAFNITRVSRVRPQPLRQTRFVLDSHLGRLAVYLRMLGFDTLYRSDYGDGELARICVEERRVLLTRDRGLLMRAAVTRGYFVRQRSWRQQLIDVIRRFDLAACTAPLTRCLRCNEPLEAVTREAVADRVPPRSREHCDRYWQCRGCSRLYWNGSHYRRMLQFAEQVLRSASGEPGNAE
ncbi:MAG TPA: Mut7-C RNAse domain-containing protein [Acidobacteriota bacterium]|nr:Mut7-C RNAse domain-containing protein [Acidobacteriota bacterium]